MNTWKKVSLGVVLGALSLTAGAGVRVQSVATPDLSRLTADLTETVFGAIAGEVREQLRQALGAPRTERAPRAPAVTVSDTITVVVEASRLPPLDGFEAESVRTAHAGAVRF